MNLFKLSFCFFLILTTHTYGQNFKAEVIFKDGRILSGLGEPAHKDLIRFKAEKKAKKEFYSFSEVDTIKVYYGFDPTIFVYQKIKGRTYPDVLEVVHVGKNVIVYEDNTQGFMALNNAGQANNTWNRVSIKHSFVRKPDEDEATHLGSNEWMSKNFKRVASDFFSDCAGLVEKIQNKELRKKDLVPIIQFYNDSCE